MLAKVEMQDLNQCHNQYFLMRHGESLANRRGIIVSHVKNALNDYGLTTLGAEQVMQTALKTRLDRQTLILSSDYKRAAETAETLHSVIDAHAPIQFDQRLRERDFGDWELTEDANYEKVWQNDLTKPETKIDNVETIDSTLTRTLDLINSLESEHQSKTILLVAHGDVLQILLAHVKGIDPRLHRSLLSVRNAEIRSLSA